MKSICYYQLLSPSLIHSQAHTLTNHDSAVSDWTSPKGFAPPFPPALPPQQVVTLLDVLLGKEF